MQHELDGPPEFPWFIKLHWGWLLAAALLEYLIYLVAVLRFHCDIWASLHLQLVDTVWLFLQAAWLRKVRPESTALYWFFGKLILDLVLWSDRPNHVWSNSYAFVGLLDLVATIAGIFAIRLYMTRYFFDAYRVDLRMSRWLTFFFNVFYFQYKFNEVAELKGLE